MQESSTSSNSEITENSIFSYKLCWYLAYFVFFFLILWLLKTYFVPYYKTVLKHKLREYIVLSHLDSSGESIQHNKTSSDDFLKWIETTENIFGLV
jgi:hypothetical protein